MTRSRIIARRHRRRERAEDFGDARLAARFRRVSATMAASPEASFPRAFDRGAELEAAYRFLNNPRVTMPELLKPHYEATAGRCQAHPWTVLVHDTTEARFGGSSPRDGLGWLSGPGGLGQGFFAHVTLAVTADEQRAPLGVLGLSTWVRQGERKRKSEHQGGRNGEYLRWEQQALETEKRLPSGTRAVHVMDREADCYALFAALSSSGFVIRVRGERGVLSATGEDVPLRDAAAQAPVVFEREVQLSRRQLPAGKAKATPKMHPPRDARTARLAVSATPVILRRSRGMPTDTPDHQVLNVVRIVEVDAPAGVEPVEWLLVTNLAVDTPEQLARIVDCYRARWRVEEYFKALKSGCKLEERQLESLHALTNAMALLVPIAWQMLAMRTLERAAPDAPATRILTRTQLDVLRTRPAGEKMPASPTVRDALYAIARMGGHLRHNGSPGWQTLAYGFHDLYLLEIGWVARGSRCDE
jgi:hypothetical protein